MVTLFGIPCPDETFFTIVDVIFWERSHSSTYRSWAIAADPRIRIKIFSSTDKQYLLISADLVCSLDGIFQTAHTETNMREHAELNKVIQLSSPPNDLCKHSAHTWLTQARQPNVEAFYRGLMEWTVHLPTWYAHFGNCTDHSDQCKWILTKLVSRKAKFLDFWVR